MISFREELLAAGVLIATGVDGLYGRSLIFERIVDGLDRMITTSGAALHAEGMRFPPGMSRTEFQRSEYLKSFPHLAGTIHCFCGDERDHRNLLRCVAEGEDWSADNTSSDIVLSPAACYPVYPIIAARGNLPSHGVIIDVSSWCFRHEPSLEPTRQQMFRMREYVCIGTEQQVRRFRQMWLDRAPGLMAELQLPNRLDVANDPFFGRGGQVLADSQRDQQLKFELLIPVNGGGPDTACISFNYHVDHFGKTWNIRDSAGEIAHTACCGFGLERLTLALLRHHGFDPAQWPAGARATLSL